MEQPQILIVDDQPEFLEIFSTKLRSSGFKVETANSGTLALAKAAELRPALILLDVEMPGVSGSDVLMALRDDPRTKDIKVVFLTNLGLPEQQDLNERISKEMGATDYIKKSEDLEALVANIKEILSV